jgi:hypothetical protein
MHSNMKMYDNMRLDSISEETDAPLVININDRSSTFLEMK